MESTDVLVVGAGPTGLVLALWLTRLGIRVRIVDKAAEPGTTSRALAVHARTLELYRQMGLADALVQDGLELVAANLWARGQRRARAAFGRMGAGLSPYPFVLICPQDEHERILVAQLERLGVAVERTTELVGFDDEEHRVIAHLKRADGMQTSCAASYLAGCDGARSTVRESLGIRFAGGTYEHTFYVADVEASGPVLNGELHIVLDDADFLGVFPLKNGRARLVGTVVRQDEDLEWRDVDARILSRMRIRVGRVNWFSTYRVHHRVAERFRRGRVFLLGDAAHIHSPVGGQGMNTGIGDAVNLAWKLAAALQGRADARVLDTYEPERIAFARRLVDTTDRVFRIVTRSGGLARIVRVHVAPRIVATLFARPAFRRYMFRTISQIAIRYRESPLSEGAAERLRGGDRLPWIPSIDNFAPLTTVAWQVHVYGNHPPRSYASVCAARHLPLYVFPCTSDARTAGIARNVAYLVRPDGYLGLVDPEVSDVRLEAYLDAHGIWLPATSNVGSLSPSPSP